MGQLREDGARRPIAIPRAAGSLLTSALIVARSHPNLGHQASGSAKAGHVNAGLGHPALGPAAIDAGNRIVDGNIGGSVTQVQAIRVIGPPLWRES
jgi:hypothetical protein